MARFLPDKFLTILIATIILASFLPVSGKGADWFSLATKCAVALLFFLHGARLSGEAVLAGVTHWRLHLMVFLSTFVLFPILGLGAGWLIPSLKQSIFYAGILYLCVLPSTVQSSIAFTSIAGGNVPAAIVSASASNILGMFVTPFLVGLLFQAHSGAGISLDAFLSIIVQLLLPFLAGQLCRRFLGSFLNSHKTLTSIVDRGSIVMVVYLAFSEAVTQKLWANTSWHDLMAMVGFDVVLLFLVLTITWWSAKLLKFNEPDCITIMFCGSKKSLASGAPMANAIFSSYSHINIGAVVLPLMLFHQIQLMACTIIARHLSQRKEKRDD
ncbi:bile acid:sodium symporter [Bartonella sp. HY329]|uniref:bile acid:sodium symporter family protein n=1 Tax=unclassified Bartonella TaxID=2645622 RepID=UPI0021C65589|nr:MULTISPECIES: bile acid:sodium symporter family protein [unclassified Bartonella]UXM94095.1 bile acid:sodium symporter [Bartonella sp. HY329]UXN08417.1 bile acid:sodium symporter [Bartonella sp. HY328]